MQVQERLARRAVVIVGFYARLNAFLVLCRERGLFHAIGSVTALTRGTARLFVYVPCRWAALIYIHVYTFAFYDARTEWETAEHAFRAVSQPF